MKRWREHSPLIIAAVWCTLMLCVALAATGCATTPEPVAIDTLHCIPMRDGPPICTPSRELTHT